MASVSLVVEKASRLQSAFINIDTRHPLRGLGLMDWTLHLLTICGRVTSTATRNYVTHIRRTLYSSLISEALLQGLAAP